MKQKAVLAFTLIELIVVITIVGMISLATYMPYAHHQQKTLVKQAAKEFSQTLSESRNLAIHGLDTWSWNVYVWIHIVPWSTNLDYYTSTRWLDILSLPATPYKVKKLPRWVEVMSINWDDSSARLLEFAPITWSWEIVWISDDILEIVLRYKKSDSPALQKKLTYYRKSFISDY